MILVKPTANGKTAFFRFKPKEDPDKREQDYLKGRGEFSPKYAEAFDVHLQKLIDYPEFERLWFGVGEAIV